MPRAVAAATSLQKPQRPPLPRALVPFMSVSRTCLRNVFSCRPPYQRGMWLWVMNDGMEVSLPRHTVMQRQVVVVGVWLGCCTSLGNTSPVYATESHTGQTGARYRPSRCMAVLASKVCITRVQWGASVGDK